MVKTFMKDYQFFYSSFFTQIKELLHKNLKRLFFKEIVNRKIKISLLNAILLSLSLLSYVLFSSYSSYASFYNTNLKEDMGDAESFNKQKYFIAPPPKNDDRKSPLLIISLDGGGIRGVLPATFLTRLEDKLEEQLHARVNLAECVDIMAGTSTGGLIALGLNAPNEENIAPQNDAATIASFYKEKGPEIFPQGNYFYRAYQTTKSGFTPKYNRNVLERLIDERFPTLKRSLQESFSSLIIPTYNASIGKFEVFTEDHKDCLLRDAALATSAAPYYLAGYKATRGSIYLDGGIIANNPSLNVFRNNTVINALQEERPVYLLSIGTGHKQGSKDYSTFETLGGAKLVYHVQDFLSLIMQGTSQNTHEILSQLHQGLKGRFHYIPIEPSVPDDSLDNSSAQNISNLENVARSSFEESYRKHELDPFIAHIGTVAQSGTLLLRRLERHKEKDVTTTLDLSRIPNVVMQLPQIKLLDYIKLENLKYLSLSNTVRGAESASSPLQSIHNYQLPHLKIFDFSHNNIGHGFINSKCVDHFIVSKGLQILLLHSNGFTNEHAEKIASALKKWPLNHLDLSHNSLNATGVESLVTSFPASLPFLLNVVNEGENRIQSLTITNAIIVPFRASRQTKNKFETEFSQATDKQFILY